MLTSIECLRLIEYLVYNDIKNIRRNEISFYKKLARKIKNNQQSIFYTERNNQPCKIQIILKPGGFKYRYWHYIPIKDKHVLAVEEEYKWS